ncbi:MAG TPA: hypothetical protein VFU72_06775 [Nitrolancea sp.]|nr:hypothetical protein [Nitrolancea sp.]
MKLRRIIATSLTTLALAGLVAVGGAGAAPLNSPREQTIALTCQDNDLGISNVDLATLDNNGSWTPGHILTINGQPAAAIAVPLEFHFTFTFGDQSFSADQVKPGSRNGITATATCSGSETITDEDGNTGTFDVTVTFFVAPRG